MQPIRHAIATRLAASLYGFEPNDERIVILLIASGTQGLQVALLAPGVMMPTAFQNLNWSRFMIPSDQDWYETKSRSISLPAVSSFEKPCATCARNQGVGLVCAVWFSPVCAAWFPLISALLCA